MDSGQALCGQAVYRSPYVEQIERLTDSVKQLSQAFLQMEEKKQAFSGEEIDGMFERVKERVCGQCEKCSWCWGENFIHTYQIGYAILSAVDRYGTDLNMETKRKLQQKCERAPRFLREMVEAFHDARQTMMWMNRMVQSREGYVTQLDTFAELLQSTSKELEKSIVTDERIEKKIINGLKRKGVRVLDSYFFLNQEGKYEIHVTARAMKDQRVTYQEVTQEISKAMGHQMVCTENGFHLLNQEYTNIVCIEGAAFYTIQGVARIGKGCNKISGDNFTMMDLPCGKQCAALSDGMGCGEKACEESTLVIELLEELLAAGFPEKAAIQMINTTLVMGREEIHYSTVDMSVFHLYTGECEIIKAGASSTFIKRKDKVEHLSSTSLPIGVTHKLEVDSVTRQLEDGDFIIMVTDGILDALPVGEQDLLLETMIQGTNMNNPKEMAHHILQQVLNWTGEEPEDDMTVLVVGIWERHS